MPQKKRRVGEVRPSQVIHTFGVGALIDLPHFSAVVMGLEEWDPPYDKTLISEDRLLGLVQSYLGDQVKHLAKPPTPPSDSRFDPADPEQRKGVPVVPFPNWVRCPNCDLIAPLDWGVFELKDDPWRPDQTRYVHTTCQRGRKPTVVPVRFLTACEHGHVGDFPWMEFVHGGATKCVGPLRLHEFGVSAEAADIVVKCDGCETSRPMTAAYNDPGDIIKKCTGRHPHLKHEVNCKQEAKAMLAGASNLWFPVTVSALAVPTEKGELAQLVRDHWQQLDAVTSRDVLAAFRAARIFPWFDDWADDRILEAIEAHRAGGGGEQPRGTWELKNAEWEVFSNPGSATESRDFRLAEVAAPPGYEQLIERVVLVERLRVVQALIGFTRIFSPGDYADINEIEESRRAPLARSRPEWVPASEVRGEGLFIQFKEDALVNWAAGPGALRREQEFLRAHTDFRTRRRIEDPAMNFPGLRYVLLHSLSHALIRQFSVACGYGAASLQERIYALDPDRDDGPQAGILLYTAAPDSEGTLGGLVALGRPTELARHLDQGLEDMRLCASDPLCSEHHPAEEGTSLHGAACHACLLTSETSCERGNKYLDRTLLVETIGGESAPILRERVTDG